ncbi:hypothetical protein HNQ80_004115 [Anaerosolibacter carboniphilus]|uniref:Copper amine oxidase-like N-terminal domain-containing protein n=1 Tax=Anaerosolibacter carboniphilus TaxID=1417629 RepID=A0A841L069_9FIRM|nr:copper amine oxidase N-terminal domain-containing protein [Anaerosolibacter carboniphilus]MBB6217978.1 hypothetical protein [Anaerosolibacter carboniphilus]
MRGNKILSVALVTALVLSSATISLAAPKGNAGKGNNEKTVKKSESTKPEKSVDSATTENQTIETATTENQTVETPSTGTKTKAEIKKEIKNLREAAKQAYTEEEVQKINESIEAIKASNPNVKVIPVENIISKNMKIKFDTPPVIKDGRTLVPVRALTQAFGAEVGWNSETKEVTISKGDVEIVLKLGSNIAIVNGQEVEIEVPAETINSRTVIPLRFIVESLGLKTNWDEDSETIEIIDEDQTTDETTTDDTTVTNPDPSAGDQNTDGQETIDETSTDTNLDQSNSDTETQVGDQTTTDTSAGEATTPTDADQTQQNTTN